MPFGISRVSLKITQSAFEESSVTGSIALPFFDFDEPLEVEIAIGLDGGFTARIATANGLATLRKPPFVELNLESIALTHADSEACRPRIPQ
jgi:hypothetical protein